MLLHTQRRIFQFGKEPDYLYNVRFQKIFIPTPRKVIGNSKGEGGLKAQIFKGKYKAKLEIPGGWGWGEAQTKKTFRGEGMDIFWNHTIDKNDVLLYNFMPLTSPLKSLILRVFAELLVELKASSKSELSSPTSFSCLLLSLASYIV